MEIYNTEEQQAEAIKAWWKDNGKAIVLGAVLGLGGMFGWRAWNEHQHAQLEAGAVAYAGIVKSLAEQHDKAFPQAEAFIKQHAGSTYGDMAAMQLAAAAVKSGHLDVAAAQLQLVVDNSKNDALKPLAAVRLARVLGEQGKVPDALKLLESVKDKAYATMVAEARGDLYLQLGDRAKAYAAYQDAADKAEGAVNPELQMKLDELTPLPAATEEKTNA